VADWTRDKTFFATKESSFDVPMMVNQKKYLAFENEELKLIKLPYRRSEKGAPDLEMLILLPNDLEGLADLEKALTLEQLNQWTQAMKKRDVSLTLPKFKVLETIELKDILSSLGMRVPFTRLADFGGISEDTALGIDKIIHKAFLEVNEEGTEAAAVTAVVMQTTCAYEPSEPLIFCADHPFIYILKEKKSGMILFMGRVSRPSCSP
jgi:serpin B